MRTEHQLIGVGLGATGGLCIMAGRPDGLIPAMVLATMSHFIDDLNEPPVCIGHYIENFKPIWNHLILGLDVITAISIAFFALKISVGVWYFILTMILGGLLSSLPDMARFFGTKKSHDIIWSTFWAKGKGSFVWKLLFSVSGIWLLSCLVQVVEKLKG